MYFLKKGATKRKFYELAFKGGTLVKRVLPPPAQPEHYPIENSTLNNFEDRYLFLIGGCYEILEHSE